MRAAGRGLAWHGADLGSVSVDSDDENKNLSLVLSRTTFAYSENLCLNNDLRIFRDAASSKCPHLSRHTQYVQFCSGSADERLLENVVQTPPPV